jgi:hypothetical protein
MAMSARDFMERLQQVKAGVQKGEATPEVEAKLAQLAQAVRTSWAPDDLKAALAANSPVPTSLEEMMTTLFMSWMSTRGRS